eukprot:GGOE01008096.1.p1 GENE.GGOE01008096.1~~GGOE01008096.1.p1  ORF type:complete len:454 (+),score=99.56 GGOE01008096.1:42-1403(+)
MATLEMTYSQVPAQEAAQFGNVTPATNVPQEEVMFDFGDATKSLRLDPRNNLPLVTIPRELEKTGGVDWNESVIYWFGMVDRCTQWWRKERRLILVGDEVLYVAFPGSIVTRCIPIKGIKSILISHDQKWVNVLMVSEHDLRFTCLEPCTGCREGKSVTAFLGAVATVWGNMYHKALPTYRMPASTNYKEVLNLSKNTWRWGQHGPVIPPRPREELFSHLIQSRSPGAPVSLPSKSATFPRTLPRSMMPYDMPESDPVAYGLPPSTMRPPVSANSISGRAWSSESRDEVPLSARRPPVSAPYYDRMDSSFTKKEQRVSSRGSEGEDDQDGEEDSDASGQGSGRKADPPRAVHRTSMQDSIDATPVDVPTLATLQAPAEPLREPPIAAKPVVATPPPPPATLPLPETQLPVPETRYSVPETRLPVPEGPLPSSEPPSGTPAKKAFVFPSVNASL